jgi:molecular chaperone DnaK
MDFETELPAPDEPPAKKDENIIGQRAAPKLVFPDEQPALPPPPPMRPRMGTGTAVMERPAPPPAAPAPPPPKPPLLIDVTPLSLSVETVGGFCDVLIDCNTPVPCDRTRIFLTASDNQTAVFVRVAQGESKKFAENTFLGELELAGLTAAKRGEVQIAVTFEIDADGILNVKAKDVKSARETRARMHLFGQQTEDHEIAAMAARQAKHAVG